MFSPKFLISLSFVIASVSGVFFWIMPLWNDVESGIAVLQIEREGVRGVREEKKRELEKTNETREEFLELREKICEAGIASNCSSADTDFVASEEPDLFILPPREDIPEYLAELTALANDNGLVMKSISFQPSRVSPQSGSETGVVEGRVGTDITLVGTYYSLKSFLAGIENSQRLIDVTQISFSQGGESDSYEFSVSLTAYFQP